jgi:hypothetical protein
MLVCKECHDARQARDYQESQPLQFTGYETTQARPTCCPDCAIPSKGARYEYFNAYELAGELVEAKYQLETQEERPLLDVPGFYDAAEMLHAVTLGNRSDILSDPEMMLQVLRYAADCEAR